MWHAFNITLACAPNNFRLKIRTNSIGFWRDYRYLCTGCRHLDQIAAAAAAVAAPITTHDRQMRAQMLVAIGATVPGRKRVRTTASRPMQMGCPVRVGRKEHVSSNVSGTELLACALPNGTS